MRIRLVLLAATAAIAGAADYLPLEPGNTWTYRQAGGRHTFTVTVGANQALIGGQVYHRLTGYVTNPVWVRAGEDGLYFRDEERGIDRPLTPFIPSSFWYEAPLRECTQEARAVPGKEPYEGPAGRYGPPLLVEYRTFDCADAGVTREEFLENIGMVRREVTTIAGPRVYDLVHARVSGLTVAGEREAAFRVSIERIEDERLEVALRLSVRGTPIRLVFPSSQEYDLQLRDARGNVLYTWSADKLFLQALHERIVEGELVFTVEIPLAKPLDVGVYKVEGWLTAGESHREFSASATFDVGEPQARSGAQAPSRLRPASHHRD
jgi:hypothetical protein